MIKNKQVMRCKERCFKCSFFLCMHRSGSILQDPCTPDTSNITTVDEWLDGIKMGQYKDNFSSAGYGTLDTVVYINSRYCKR